MTSVWKFAPYREGTLLVLLAMADWADDEGGRIFPRVATLATKARLSTRATQSALRRLEKDGVIECIRRANGQPGRANDYRINLERVKELHGCRSHTRETGNGEGRSCERVGAQLATAHIESVKQPSSEPSSLTPRGGRRVRSKIELKKRADFEVFLASGGRRWQTAPIRSAEEAWRAVEEQVPPSDIFATCMTKFWAAHEAEEKRLHKAIRPLGPARFMREEQWRCFISTGGPAPETWRTFWGGHPAIATLVSEIGLGAVNIWFGDSVLEQSDTGAIIRSPFRVKRDEIARRFISHIARALNVAIENVQVKVDTSLPCANV